MRVRRIQRGWGAMLALLWVVAASARDTGHEWVADGPAFMRTPAPAGSRQLTTVPTAERNITQSSGDDRDPCWSPDGTVIAFASNRGADFDIYISRTDGSDPDTGAALSPKLVSGLPGNERYPAWSPGGTELAYVRDTAIYVRNLRTGVESLVSDSVGQPTGLVFSFDGQRLAFSTMIGTDIAPNIYWISLDPNNRNLEQVTDTAANDVAPAWFPRSNELLFASDRDGDFDVFQVTVPGIGEGPVPDNDPSLRKLIGGLGNQTEPAWVNAGGIISDPAYNQQYHILYADDDGGREYDLKVADSDLPTPDPVGDVVFTDRSATQPADQTEPFANPLQNSTSNYCAFAGNQTGNFEIYTIEIFDGSPPVLSDGLKPRLPTVTPQRTFPGANVLIEAPVFDVGRGVGEVWAVFRLAERSVYQRNSYLTGNGADDGVINSSGNDRWAMGLNTYEFEQTILNATTFGTVDPTTVNVTQASLISLVQTVGLRLNDDGNNGDKVAGDGVFSRTWRTPGNIAEDYYVDIVPFDNVGNVPVDTNLGINSRPGGGSNPLLAIQTGFTTPFYVIGYDHVAGFTTRQLDLTRKILFVSDYACGQKFQVADFAGAQQTTLSRFWPAALSVEHYYFNSDDDNTDNAISNGQRVDTPRFVAIGNAPTLTGVGNPYDGAWGGSSPTPPLNDPAPWTGDPAMIERFGGTSPYGGPEQADRAAVWRVLCRGPVDASTYNAYTPLPLAASAGSPIPAQDADRMILWISPYTGDLFVQDGVVADGTLLSADVQSSLTNFVASGGRLFVSGQDIAWALTKNGTQSNSFLTSTLRATFNSDAPPDIANATVRSATDRRVFNIPAASTMQGIEQSVFVTRENPITNDLYPDFYRWRGGNGEVHRPDDSDTILRLNTGFQPGESAGQSVAWAGDGCANQWYIDDVRPANGGIATLDYSRNGLTAMLRYLDSTGGGRVVFACFGFEAVRNCFRYYPNYRPTNQNWIVGHENRMEMFTNISDYLRTGGLMGKVVGPDGSTPAGGITVVARLGPQPDAQVMGTAVTLEDGTYLLRGLSTATYGVYVVSDEFTADHRPYQPVFGGQITQNSDLTIRLLRFETGTVYGTVTQTGGATVSGAKVTVTLQTTGTNPLSKEVQTDNNGQYSLDVPAGTYTVTAEATGFGSASTTDVVVVAGDFVQVDLVLQPGPGTLSGRVAGKNQPLGGAVVAILQNGVTVASTSTTAAGVYSIELAAGTYSLSVTAAGFKQATRTDVTVVSDTVTANVDFDLEPVPPGGLIGLVTLQGSSSPVAGITINLITGGAILRSTTTAGQTSTLGGVNYNFRFDDVPAGLYDVALLAQGYSDDRKAGLQVKSGEVTSGVDFSLQPLHTFVSGLSMTSTPFDYASAAPDIQTLIDDDNNPDTPLKLASYDTLGRKYLYYPNRPSDTLRLGVGYFMKLSQNVPLTVEGIRAPVVGSGTDIQLLSGWNLLGHVYEFPVDLFSCSVLFQNQTYTMQAAASQGLLNASLFTLNFNQYQQVFRLDPYTAYWIRAFQNVIFRIPGTASRSLSEPGDRHRVQPTLAGWVGQIQATMKDGRQAVGEFGVDPEAADVYDPTDRLQPPPPPAEGWLQITFPHPEWGRFAGDYHRDLRHSGQRLEWLLNVDTAGQGGEVALHWPQLATAVPGRLRVVLEDLETGWQRSLRHTGGYQYVSGGGVRQFRLRVEPQDQALTFPQVRFTPGRGGGGTLSYTVSAAARLEVVVKSAAGRVLRHLVHGAAVEAGTHTVTWDGRDDAGRLVPNGSYRLDLVGVTELGEQVRVTRLVNYRR